MSHNLYIIDFPSRDPIFVVADYYQIKNNLLLFYKTGYISDPHKTVAVYNINQIAGFAEMEGLNPQGLREVLYGPEAKREGIPE